MESPPPQSPLLAALGLDLESSLDSEPRFLMDARFLGALHTELVQELGECDAAGALLQMGFVHGLRDAAEVVSAGLNGNPGASRSGPTAPRLAIRMAPGAQRDGSLELRGGWPERHEAEAVLSSVGRQQAPCCAASVGYTSGWLSGIFGGDVLVVETGCGAGGADGCDFMAREAEAWRELDDPRAQPWLAALPFAALRELVARHQPASEPSQANEGFEAGAPVIHVWGPVMVMPFAGVDESMRALDLIGADPGARDVRVVVVDLSGAIIDEGFGAVALEQIVGAIQGWGAEAILTGISPLSARVVGEFEHQATLLHKDLPEAIAAAFRIAEAQRISA